MPSQDNTNIANNKTNQLLETNNTDESIVLITGESEPDFWLSVLSRVEYDKLSLEQRRQKTQKTIEYIRVQFDLPNHVFKKEDGSDIDCLTLARFRKIIEENRPTQPSWKDVPRMPNEVCIHWVSLLQKELSRLEKLRQADAEPSSQENIVKRLLDEQKSNWLKQDFTFLSMKSTLQKESEILRQAGLKVLADAAYSVENKNCLFRQLPLSNDFPGFTTRLNQDFYGQVFERYWLNAFSKNPSTSLLHTFDQINLAFEGIINALADETSREKLALSVQKSIINNKQTWFEKVPQIRELANKNTAQELLTALRNLLKTPAKNRYDIMAGVYLGQKIFDAYRPIAPQSNLSEKHEISFLGNIFETTLMLTPNSANNPRTDFSSALNSWLESLAYFKKELNMDFNTKEALLGGLLLTQYENNSSLLKALSFAHKKSTQLGLDIFSSLQIQSPESFVFNYESLFNLYSNTLNAEQLNEAKNIVWKKTLDYFSKVSRYANDFPLGDVNSDDQHYISTSSSRPISAHTTQLVTQLIEFLTQEKQGINSAYVRDRYTVMTKKLHQLINDKVRQSRTGKSKLEVANKLFDAIKRSKKIPDTLDQEKQEILALLSGIMKKEKAEPSLLQEMKKHSEFASFSKKDVWRLVLDLYQQENRGEYGFENEPGYMAAMLSAFEYMLKNRHVPLSSDYLLTLHDHAVNDVTRNIPAWIFGQSISPTQPLGKIEKISKGFRSNSNGFRLTLGRNATQAGIKELAAKAKAESYGYFRIMWDKQDQNHNPILDEHGSFVTNEDGCLGQLITFPTTPERAKDRAQTIIDAYHQELAVASGDSGKLTAIARVCRDLESAHLFLDGNARTIGMLLINHLLLQNGFTPTILHNPNSTDAYSVAELVTQIKRGQLAFRGYRSETHLPSDSESDTDTEQRETPSTSEDSQDSTQDEDAFVQQTSEEEIITTIKNKYIELESALLDQNHPDFTQSRNSETYKSVAIPGYLEGMSLLEMQALAVEKKLTLTQLGALSRRIMQASYMFAEPDSLVQINRSLKISASMTFFSKNGATRAHTLGHPSLYELPEESRTGLCYGMTMVAATALVQGGKQAITHLSEKVSEANNYAGLKRRIIFNKALTAVHRFANQEYLNNRGRLYTKLATFDDIKEILSNSLPNSMFEMGSENHAMLIGAIGTKEKLEFCFYDPNEEVVVYFPSAEKLVSALEQHFTPERLARYNVITANEPYAVPKFQFEFINLKKIANINIEVESRLYLKINSLFEKPSLTAILASQRELRRVAETSVSQVAERLNSDIYLQLSLTKLKSDRLAKNFFDATQSLLRQHDLGSDWLPLLPKTETLPSGEYNIFLIGKTNPHETRVVKTNDVRFIETKNYLDSHISNLVKAAPFTGFTDIASVDGMNAGFAVQQLVTWMMEKGRQSQVDQPISASLALAINIHTYLGVSQMAHATMQDLGHIAQIVKALSKSEVTIGNNVLHTINSTLAFGFGAGFVILDTWELTQAQNPSQKTNIKVQLVFDSAAFLDSAASLGAGWIGASTTAAFLGYLGVPLSGITVGATALAKVYGEVANDAEQVGKAFEQIDKAYKNKIYRYDTDNSLLSSLPHGIVKELNLKNKTISFGTQFVYACDDGYVHNNVIRDRKQAIALRDALGYTQDTQALAEDISQALLNGRVKRLILPTNPAYYISPYHQYMLGITKTNVSGSDILNRLEKKDNRFTFECFHFPYKHLFRSLEYEFVPTTIKIVLDVNSPVLIIPEIDKSLRGYLTYHLQGSGGEVVLNINEGVRIELSDQPNTATKWILDTRLLAHDQINIYNDRLLIGGISITAQNQQLKNIKIIKQDGSVAQINLSNKTLEDIYEDATQWRQHSQVSIESHLQTLAKEHRLASNYTPVNNYQFSSQYQGSAYYDVAKDRMLFTQMPVDTLQIIALFQKIQAKPLICIQEKKWTLHDQSTPVQRITYAFKITQQNEVTQLRQLANLSPNHPHSQAIKEYIAELENAIDINNTSLASVLASAAHRLDLIPQSHFPASYFVTQEIETIPDATSKRLDLFDIKTFMDRSGQQFLHEIGQLQRDTEVMFLLFKEGRLAGVINNEAYFYHASTASFWKTDAATNMMKVEFKTFILNMTGTPSMAKDVHVWQEGERIYATLSYTAMPDYPLELTYHLYDNQIQLVGITYDGNHQTNTQILVNNLNTHNRIKSSALKFLLKLRDNSAAEFWGSYIAKASVAPLITCTVRNTSSNTYRYWVASEHYTLAEGESENIFQQGSDTTDAVSTGTIIKLFLPTSDTERPPTDIIFVGSLEQKDEENVPSTKNVHPRIFYFYSHTQKKLYRQVGPGSTQLTTHSGAATTVNLPGLENVIGLINDVLLATTENGLAYHINAAGKYVLAGVSARWLNVHQNNWKYDLNRLATSPSPLAIFGISKNGRDNLAVWYFEGYLIALCDSLQNKSLNFIGMSRYTTGRAYVVLFDTVSGKLYRQPLIDQIKPFVFGTSVGQESMAKLELQAAIPSAQTWFDDKCFKSVSKIDYALRFVTSDGEILTLDAKGQLQLIGVDAAWQQRYRNDPTSLLNALKMLTTSWAQHNDAIALEQVSHHAPIWYHKKMHRLIKTNEMGFTEADKVSFIGTSPDQQTIWLYSAVRKQITSVQHTQSANWSAVENIAANGATRKISLLQITGTEANDQITPPCIDDVETIVLSACEGADEYRIPYATWRHYSNIVIDNADSSVRPARDKVILEVGDPQALIISKKDDDLLIYEQQNRHSLLLRGVGGQQSAMYGHMQLVIKQTQTTTLNNVPSPITTEIEDLIAKLAGQVEPTSHIGSSLGDQRSSETILLTASP